MIQAFLDDRDVRKVLWGASAREKNERTLGTKGNLFAALFTAPRTGRVLPRLVPLAEIRKIIKNPEDRTEPWFYQRVSVDARGRETTGVAEVVGAGWSWPDGSVPTAYAAPPARTTTNPRTTAAACTAVAIVLLIWYPRDEVAFRSSRTADGPGHGPSAAFLGPMVLTNVMPGS